jgi:hypothetical protein
MLCLIIPAPRLTDIEASNVEGEGVGGIILASILSGVFIPIVYTFTYNGQIASGIYSPERAQVNAVTVTTVLVGGLMVAGYFAPF